MGLQDCSFAADRKIWPVVDCRYFDFTLAFEHVGFVSGISVIFLLVFIPRIKGILEEDIKAISNHYHKLKIIFAISDLGLQIARLVLWIHTPLDSYSIMSGCLAVAASLGVLVFVAIQHTKTIRPSSLISLYLLAIILVGGIELRTLLLRGNMPLMTKIVAASVVNKTTILILESTQKERILKLGVKYSPEETSGIFNRSLLWWLNPLFSKGYMGILKQEDLFPLDQELNSANLRDRMISCWEKNKSKRRYPLIQATASLLWRQIFATIPPRICLIITMYAQTFVLSAAIRYMEMPNRERDPSFVYALIAASFLSYFGTVFFYVFSTSQSNRIQSTFRGAMVSLIYHHSLSTSSTESDLAAVTLMSTDVESIESSFFMLLEIWAYAIEVIIGVWLLWMRLGPVAIGPLLIMAVCSYVQTAIGKAMSTRRAVWTAAIQKRVALTTKLLRSMKSVKLTGMVDTSANLVQSERVRELELGKKFRWLIIWMNGVGSMPFSFSSLIVFATYAIQAKLQGKPPLTTSQAFSSLAIMMIFRGPAAILLISVPMSISTVGTFERIEKFLQKNRFEDHRPLLHGPASLLNDERAAIELKDVMLDTHSDNEPLPIAFTAASGSITMISGPVGCGKSVMLKAILGEIDLKSGRISVSTPFIAYCAQTPWLQNSTLKNNIVGANEFNETWYQSIIRVCNLEPDIVQMPDGHDTLLGSRGIAVSGGQKHRIALARALYSRSSILLLDDLFSSLDRKTQNAVASRLLSADGHAKKHGITVLFTTHSAALVRFAQNVLVLEAGGSLKFAGPTEDWSKEKSAYQELILLEDEPAVEEPPKLQSKGLQEAEDENETLKRQAGDTTLWLYYLNSFGVPNLVLIIVLNLVATLGGSFPQIWLKYTTGSYVPPVGVFIGVFAAVSFITWSAQVGEIVQIMIRVGVKSAIHLHQVLVTATFNAPMSYFESTDTSILINKFSQDMSLIEMDLPISVWQLLNAFVKAIVSFGLLSSGSNFMVLTVPFVLFILYWTQYYYLRTSRQLRLLDLEAKSPMYRHFTETLEGLATIRAFGWQDAFEKEAIECLEESQKPDYLRKCTAQWLSIILELLGSTLAVTLTAVALLNPWSSDAGSLGVGLSTATIFTAVLNSLITNWTKAESSLGSIARTRTFEQTTPSENNSETIDPGDNWPVGNVEVSNITIVYKDGTAAVKKVEFAVEQGQKLGICGRTGSGKSTLVSVLLRLMDPTSGAMIVDGIDISTVSRNLVRQRLICLPQDPLLLPGTFQSNLDPKGLLDAAKMEAILQRMEIWELIANKGGLGAEIPESLSHGEQQLIALARAVVSKQAAGSRCILVLDEATSNLDTATEAVIQRVLQEEFKDTTVIAIAHRLETLRGFDTVVVLDKGEVSMVGSASKILAELVLE